MMKVLLGKNKKDRLLRIENIISGLDYLSSSNYKDSFDHTISKKSKVSSLTDALFTRPMNVNDFESYDDVLVIAVAIRRSLEISDPPLIPVELYDHFLSPLSDYESLLAKLPKLSQELLTKLMLFLVNINKTSRISLEILAKNIGVGLLRQNSNGNKVELTERVDSIVRMLRYFSETISTKNDNIVVAESWGTALAMRDRREMEEIMVVGMSNDPNSLKVNSSENSVVASEKSVLDAGTRDSKPPLTDTVADENRSTSKVMMEINQTRPIETNENDESSPHPVLKNLTRTIEENKNNSTNNNVIINTSAENESHHNVSIPRSIYNCDNDISMLDRGNVQNEFAHIRNIEDNKSDDRYKLESNQSNQEFSNVTKEVEESIEISRLKEELVQNGIAFQKELTTQYLYVDSLKHEIAELSDRNRQFKIQIQSKDAQISALEAWKEKQAQINNSATRKADRSALSIVISQQKLLSSMEEARTSTETRISLLEAEIRDMQEDHRLVVEELLTWKEKALRVQEAFDSFRSREQSSGDVLNNLPNATDGSNLCSNCQVSIEKKYPLDAQRRLVKEEMTKFMSMETLPSSANLQTSNPPSNQIFERLTSNLDFTRTHLSALQRNRALVTQSISNNDDYPFIHRDSSNQLNNVKMQYYAHFHEPRSEIKDERREWRDND